MNILGFAITHVAALFIAFSASAEPLTLPPPQAQEEINKNILHEKISYFLSSDINSVFYLDSAQLQRDIKNIQTLRDIVIELSKLDKNDVNNRDFLNALPDLKKHLNFLEQQSKLQSAAESKAAKDREIKNVKQRSDADNSRQKTLADYKAGKIVCDRVPGASETPGSFEWFWANGCVYKK